MRRVLTLSVLLHLAAVAVLLWLPHALPSAPPEPALIEVVFGVSHGFSPTPARPTPGGQPGRVAPPGTDGPQAGANLPAPGTAEAALPTARIRSGDPDEVLRLQHSDPTAIPAEGDPGNRNPNYPPEAAQLGEHGTVLVRMHIDAQGNVSWVETIASSGYPDLDATAEKALLRWHFHPARQDGQNVPAVRDQPVRFVLN